MVNPGPGDLSPFAQGFKVEILASRPDGNVLASAKGSSSSETARRSELPPPPRSEGVELATRCHVPEPDLLHPDRHNPPVGCEGDVAARHTISLGLAMPRTSRGFLDQIAAGPCLRNMPEPAASPRKSSHVLGSGAAAGKTSPPNT